MAILPKILLQTFWLPFLMLFAYTWIVTTLIVNILQILTLVIWPMDRSLYRKVNYILGYQSWCHFTALVQWWYDCDVKMYIDPEEAKFIGHEHVFVIMNHTYEIDWLMAWALAERNKMLGGTKIYGKQILKYIPLMGWTWHFTESIFLKRNWTKDEEIIKQGIKNMLDFPLGYWFILLLFPEGTRFTKDKHEVSLQVAKEKGYPQLKHHLLPRTKGFSTTLACVKGKMNAAVYDICVGFQNNNVKPSLMNVFKGHPLVGDMRVKRYAFEDIPSDEQESAKWLRDLFVKKDAVMESYLKEGKFEEPRMCLKRRYTDLITWVFWLTVTLIPLFSLLANIIVTGTILQRGIIVVVLGVLFFFCRWMIAFTEIEKGSKYGKAKRR